MTKQNEIHHSLDNNSFGKRALQGASIAAVLVIVFLSFIFPIGGVLNGKNFWQSLWQFFPLVTVTVGGALGGMFYYLIVKAWYPGGWKKIVATVLGILVYVLLLWLSLVAGFSATGLWD
jgi:hypothetical protein